MLFDTHAHYDDDKFNEDRHDVIMRAHESGVAYILNAASNMASAAESITLADTYAFMYAAVGVHPHNVDEMNEETISSIAKMALKPRVVAIGEIGLDYYYDTQPRDIQKYWFSRQIDLARELKLPVIVHDRDAHEDALNIIKAHDAKAVGGVFHCFTGSVEMAKDLINNNFYISIGGPVTFKNARKTIEVVKCIPDDRLLIETDCPYLTPEPHRGKRNDSGYVRLIAEKIAEIKGIAFEKVAEITTKNAKVLFNID